MPPHERDVFSDLTAADLYVRTFLLSNETSGAGGARGGEGMSLSGGGALGLFGGGGLASLEGRGPEPGIIALGPSEGAWLGLGGIRGPESPEEQKTLQM